MTTEQPIRPFLSISGSHWPLHDLENVTLVCQGLSWSLPQDEKIRYNYFWSINGTRYDPVKEQLPVGHQVLANSKGNELVVTGVMMTDNGRVYSCMTSEDGSRLESLESNTVKLLVLTEYESTVQVTTMVGAEVFTSVSEVSTKDGGGEGLESPDSPTQVGLRHGRWLQYCFMFNEFVICQEL